MGHFLNPVALSPRVAGKEPAGGEGVALDVPQGQKSKVRREQEVRHSKKVLVPSPVLLFDGEMPSGRPKCHSHHCSSRATPSSVRLTVASCVTASSSGGGVKERLKKRATERPPFTRAV